MTTEGVRSAMLDLLAKAMTDVEADLVCGFVVISYDDVNGLRHGQTQIGSASVIGPFATEMEAVEAAAIHHEQVNRGMDPASRDGWLTVVKPLVRWSP